MDIIGYIAALIIGVSLGLLGGGGSILTVPVMVYLFGVEPVLAAAYSLFIVGLSSLIGAVGKLKEGLINIKVALLFGLPSMLSVFLVRKFLVPAIPEIIIQTQDFSVVKSDFLMFLFAMLMILASRSMIKQKNPGQTPQKSVGYGLILLMGMGEGVISGLVGAGGGFIIIPALVLFCRIPMKSAIGTSLLIISVKSLIGFLGDVSNYEIDWILLVSVSLLAGAGIFIGNRLSKMIEAEKLKKGFGYFILAMAAFILFKLF